MRFISFIIALGLSLTAFGQNAEKECQAAELVGLWQVNKVQLGDEEMTPVGKWTEFSCDSIYRSGNGWLQNSKGVFNYNKVGKTIEMYDQLGIKDEYGPFKISVDGDQMVWEREEDGTAVTVFLSKTEELPMAPQDLLVGIWELQYEMADESQLSKEHLFLRWDREYRKWEGEKRSRGYWQMNAHQPVLTIIGEERTRWEIIKLDESNLELKGIESDSKEVRLHYLRKNTFPN